MPTNASPAAVKSAMRTLDILELLVQQKRPMAANEIAASLAIPVSSLAYLLATLVDRGYLQRSGRFYLPGEGLSRLTAASAQPSLADRTAPIVRSLRLQLNETATFFVRRGWEIEALTSETSQQDLRYALDAGQRGPMYSFSAGKALLATFDDAELEEYLETVPRPAFTPETITDADELRKEVETVRRAGIAHTHEEHTPGIISIGCAAVVDGVALGAFGIAIPVARFNAAVDAKAVKLLRRSVELLRSGMTPSDADAQRQLAEAIG
jgi:IclR family acetate operon transcriptional repressor